MRRHRRGVTLLEVLAAIFIMGIGTLAILVLFPLGALNMARALKDDRTGTIAVNAHAMAVSRNLDIDPNVLAVITATPPPGPPTWQAPDPGGPGYPVLVDPYYFRNGVTTNLGAVAGQTPGIQRISPAYINNDPNPALATDRWFSLLDDLTFEAAGRPKDVGQQLQRQGYYTFAYLLRRQKTAIPTTTTVTVIVYSGRPVNTPQLEPVYAVNPTAAAGATSFVLTWTAPQEAPALRRGSWLMDVSYTPQTVNGTSRGFVHGRCYRVMDATLLTANSMQVEVQSALANNNVRWMVVLDGAVEVFERGLLK
jgi:prepilin-type N-terminal cleavage/methylation domain-containing protein